MIAQGLSNLTQSAIVFQKCSTRSILRSSFSSTKKLSKCLEVRCASTLLKEQKSNLQTTFTPDFAPPFSPSKVYTDDQFHKYQRRNESHHASSSDRCDKLAEAWREIHGSDNWNGMLNPINSLLGSEIIRYGVFVRSCYEAVELETGSKNYGGCKYGRHSILSDLGMENCGYKITKYIYATPDIKLPDMLKEKVQGHGSNWMGYIAVTEDEDEIKRLGRRDIVVALRGTATPMEWAANFMSALTPARLNPSLNSGGDVKVEMGFLGLYTSEDSESRFNNGSARQQLLAEITRLVQKYKGEQLSITITGHSMGSALAMLCAYDIAELGINCSQYTDSFSSTIPITVFSFAGPRVGNLGFKQRCEELGVRILRVVNVHDVVTRLPGLIFNENLNLMGKAMDRTPWSYCHVGVELPLDHNTCPESFQPKTQHPCCIHDLATYLQLLEGQCGQSEQLEQNDNKNQQKLPTSFEATYKALKFLGKHADLNEILSLSRRESNSSLTEATIR